MKNVVMLGVLGLVTAQWLNACAGGRATGGDPFLPPENQQEESAIPPAPECVDEDDEPVKCEKDEECCPGFVCGKDPELNHRETFCIYSG